jgi:hypothetical protein
MIELILGFSVFACGFIAMYFLAIATVEFMLRHEKAEVNQMLKAFHAKIDDRRAKRNIK